MNELKSSVEYPFNEVIIVLFVSWALFNRKNKLLNPFSLIFIHEENSRISPTLIEATGQSSDPTSHLLLEGDSKARTGFFIFYFLFFQPMPRACELLRQVFAP